MHGSEFVAGTLWAQLLVQFYSDPSETSHFLLIMVWRYACVFFPNLDIFFFFQISRIFNWDFFHASILWTCICNRYLVNATPTVLHYSHWNYTDVLTIALRKHAYSNTLKILPRKNGNFSDKNFWYFSYFCSKHRLWVLVRTASSRRF